MDIRQMQDKIKNDRELILNCNYNERDFKFTEVEGFATIITGARRIGKASFLKLFGKKLINDGLNPDKICYLSFFTSEDLSFPFSLIQEAYYGLYPNFSKDKDVYFILDEVQGIKNWKGGIAYLLEMHPCHVIVTGSSAKYLSTDIATELRGRSLQWKFYPLSFHEFLLFNSIAVDNEKTYSEEERALLSHWFSIYMERSSYPALALNSEVEIKKMVLNSYYDLVFSRDLIDRFEISKSSMLRALLRRLIKNSGSPYTIRKLVNNLKSMGYSTSIELVSEYIKMILDTSFLIEVPIFGTEKQQERNDRKLYVIDHQMAILFKEFGENTGTIIEHIVLMAIKRSTNYNISYYRTKNNYECDFLVYDEERSIKALIQVTDNWDEAKEREIRAMIATLEETGLKKGLIIAFNSFETIEHEGKKIDVVPAWRFALNAKYYIEDR